MAIQIKTAAEIEKMRASGRILRQVHEAIAPLVKPGASTMDLEEQALASIAHFGVTSAFKGTTDIPQRFAPPLTRRWYTGCQAGLVSCGVAILSRSIAV